ncbi:hypothetical protein IMCC3135_34230 [Granulosicoccus antarcticus IMCC3135]|uniref:Uncharacterized protein n=1 Tax=Granulosicoccus antarcticus IMCC3135 TaxID=1192854 RepID=A0A2Z2NZM2_9GAMM|nr:hypothetical protein IMCC3135_34230 [Granulosicoccus antarcticus IMCC3135]
MSYLESEHTEAQTCMSGVDNICSDSTGRHVAFNTNVESAVSDSTFAVLDDDFFLYLGRSGCEHDSLSIPVMSNLMFIEDELASPTVFSTVNKADSRLNMSIQSAVTELYCFQSLRGIQRWCRAVLHRCLCVAASRRRNKQFMDSTVARPK